MKHPLVGFVEWLKPVNESLIMRLPMLESMDTSRCSCSYSSCTNPKTSPWKHSHTNNNETTPLLLWLYTLKKARAVLLLLATLSIWRFEIMLVEPRIRSIFDASDHGKGLMSSSTILFVWQIIQYRGPQQHSSTFG